ncbi:MAG: hypothetical protein P4N41_14010 [Negativicutes bacterium]|nr:hypothetical protein [Negativicutes bacterium]
MKKLLAGVALVVAVSIIPLAAYADDDHRDRSDDRHNGNRVEDRHDRSDDGYDHHDRHDREWNDRHDRKWKDNEREWKEHDREWREHRNDKRWREAHAREWKDWYDWHKDNENDDMRLRISTDNFDLDIDL